ncbi:GntR family transcriptional regulator [Salinibacterium sp. PAMC 21357]|uniref:GntR family transcriptional regulator n=1 Tax=Salinibacterium sp. PAMC 21357 TaxID=1112215 RepID=UPI00028962D7|nr:GntR family transcriptional regulator [Salinibacterium sp. PAMC 21357]
MPDNLTPKSKTLVREVLADHVYEAILQTLLNGEREAGASISIDGVARELGVSPTPVREALTRLEATSMVHRVALKGYRVAPLFTPVELAEWMDARLVIESVITQEACQRGTAELTTALEKSIDGLRATPLGGSYAELRAYWEADELFHQLIAENGGNQFLLAAFNSLGGQVQRLRFFNWQDGSDAAKTIAEHTSILEAFRTGDAVAARAAMTVHLESVKSRALSGASTE